MSYRSELRLSVEFKFYHFVLDLKWVEGIVKFVGTKRKLEEVRSFTVALNKSTF